MIRHKIKHLDLFIRLKNWESDDYFLDGYYQHDDMCYNLVFTFEDSTFLYNDGKQHIHVVAEYMNCKRGILVKFSNENWSDLCDEVKKWNDEHRIIPKVEDVEEDDDDNVLFKDLFDAIGKGFVFVWKKLFKK